MATLTLQPDETSGWDTFIDSGNTTTNYGTGATIGVGDRVVNTDVYRTLIKFDLNEIPKNSTITSATLSLWVSADQSNNARTFRAYRQKKAWREGRATWAQYALVSNWTTAGGFDAADCEQTDIGTASLGSGEVAGTEIQFSLTASKVEEWVNDTFANNGLLIKADTEVNDCYDFHSSSSATSGYRPKLVVVYEPSGNVTTLTADIDTQLNSAAATTNYGTDTTFKVGESFSGSGTFRGLMKFDFSSLPAGATINRARIRMVTQADDSNSNRTMKVYRQKRAWTEAGATWNKYDGTNNWSTAGGFHADDCEQTDIGSYGLVAAEQDGHFFFIDLTASKIQEMINGTFTNNGIMFKNDTETDDAVAFYSSESATTAYRPILYVDWSGGGNVIIWEVE